MGNIHVRDSFNQKSSHSEFGACQLGQLGGPHQEFHLLPDKHVAFGTLSETMGNHIYIYIVWNIYIYMDI